MTLVIIANVEWQRSELAGQRDCYFDAWRRLTGEDFARGGATASIAKACGQTDPTPGVHLETPAATTTTTAQFGAEPTLPPLATSSGFRLDGTWYHHGIVMDIDRGSYGRLTWRIYEDCDTEQRPCDIFTGNGIVDGGWASFRLLSTGPDRATGEVVATTDGDGVPLGRFTITLDVANRSIGVVFPGQERLVMCGDQTVDITDCGA